MYCLGINKSKILAMNKNSCISIVRTDGINAKDYAIDNGWDVQVAINRDLLYAKTAILLGSVYYKKYLIEFLDDMCFDCDIELLCNTIRNLGLDFADPFSEVNLLSVMCENVKQHCKEIICWCNTGLAYIDKSNKICIEPFIRKVNAQNLEAHNLRYNFVSEFYKRHKVDVTLSILEIQFDLPTFQGRDFNTAAKELFALHSDLNENNILCKIYRPKVETLKETGDTIIRVEATVYGSSFIEWEAQLKVIQRLNKKLTRRVLNTVREDDRFKALSVPMGAFSVDRIVFTKDWRLVYTLGLKKSILT